MIRDFLKLNWFRDQNHKERAEEEFKFEKTKTIKQKEKKFVLKILEKFEQIFLECFLEIQIKDKRKKMISSTVFVLLSLSSFFLEAYAAGLFVRQLEIANDTHRFDI